MHCVIDVDVPKLYNFKIDTHPLHARHWMLQTQYPFFPYSLQTELQFGGFKWGQLKNLYFPNPPCRKRWPLGQFWPMRYNWKFLNGLLQNLLKKRPNQLGYIFCPLPSHFHFFPSARGAAILWWWNHHMIHYKRLHRNIGVWVLLADRDTPQPCPVYPGPFVTLEKENIYLVKYYHLLQPNTLLTNPHYQSKPISFFKEN